MVSTRASKCLDPTTKAEKELHHKLVQKMGVRKYRKWLKDGSSCVPVPQQPVIQAQPDTQTQPSTLLHIGQPTAKSLFMAMMRTRAATRLSIGITIEQNSQYTIDMCRRHWRSVPSFETWLQEQTADTHAKYKIIAAKRLINEHIQKDLILGTPNHSRNSIHVSLSSWLDATLHRKALMEYLDTSPQCLEWFASLDPEMASLLTK